MCRDRLKKTYLVGFLRQQRLFHILPAQDTAEFQSEPVGDPVYFPAYGSTSFQATQPIVESQQNQSLVIQKQLESEPQ